MRIARMNSNIIENYIGKDNIKTITFDDNNNIREFFSCEKDTESIELIVKEDNILEDDEIVLENENLEILIIDVNDLFSENNLQKEKNL